MNRSVKRQVKPLSAQQRAARAARDAKIQQIQIRMGFAVIGVCLLISILMTIRHQLIPAVPIGLFILAALRLLFLKLEMRKSTQECTK